MVQLNNKQTVFDAPEWYQVQPGISQDLCGNAAVATLAYLGLPTKGARGTPEQVGLLAEKLATQFNAGPVNETGSTVNNMYDYIDSIMDVTGGQRALHYWTIPEDRASITSAVKAGYPVIIMANELNLKSTKTGQQPPYPWKIDTLHFLDVIGIDSSNNYIIADTANNNFQGEWPVHYDASIIAPVWACCIQVVGPNTNKPWLVPIPSGTPITWKADFNAQTFAIPVVPAKPVVVKTDYVAMQARLTWLGNKVQAPNSTGIYNKWLSLYYTLNIGTPVTQEIHAADYNGKSCIIQWFSGGYRIELVNGIYNLYSSKFIKSL